MPSATTLFRSESVVLGTSRCGATGPAPSPEEVDPEFALILPMSGVFVRHVRDEEIVANPAVALLAAAGEVSRTSHPLGGHDHSLYMCLSPELAGWFGAGHGTFPRSAPLSPSASLAARLVARRVGRGERLSSLHLEEVVASIAATWSGSVERTGGIAAVRRAEEYLAAHFSEDADLGTIAEQVGYSPHHLSRLFRRVVGVPLSVYRNRLRVAEAMSRLLDGAPDISRVAVETGFYDHAHMVRQIRNETGRTPGQLRALGGGDPRWG